MKTLGKNKKHLSLTAPTLLLYFISPFFNLTPFAFVAQPSTQPVRQAGNPLPPGTVTATNAWNQTLACPVSLSTNLTGGPLSSNSRTQATRSKNSKSIKTLQ